MTPAPVWHQLSGDQALAALQSQPEGLTPAQAEERLRRDGPNALQEKSARSPWRLLWEQFIATMVLILLGAGGVSAVLGKTQEAWAIFAIVLLFGLLGFFQEYRAEKALETLKKISAPRVRLLRGGQVKEMSASELVVGDLILLEAGSLVPADARLLDAAALKVQEAALTGESEAVEKQTAPYRRPTCLWATAATWFTWGQLSPTGGLRLW